MYELPLDIEYCNYYNKQVYDYTWAEQSYISIWTVQWRLFRRIFDHITVFEAPYH